MFYSQCSKAENAILDSLNNCIQTDCLELCVQDVQELIISAAEKSIPLKKSDYHKVPWWSVELFCVRKQLNAARRLEISGIEVSSGNFTSSFEDIIDAVLRKSFPSDPNSHDNSQHRVLRSEAELMFLLRVIKEYKTVSYEAVFAIYDIPPIDLVILNNLDVRENYLITSLGTLDGTIPVSLLPHPSCRKPITLVTYSNEIFQEYKTVCFTDGSKLNGRVGLACVIYEEGIENVTFQHRLKEECSVFLAPNYYALILP
ncbi:transforming growth factor-beta-induced protein ig-h3 [Trichonephila inaurata madagascariensis]|uniref:Transforming growth factor-beta-induced protein ig-h3 n=1 Tax=Trichonephila inaurata madagascariensis TaxID=2747483 RepID=A0A8X6Y4G7_9ARAC|nr:transforming growth factor-beta-induced protein ig-h3 [Trichonephila inaurata madagascariensis]